MPIKMHIRTMKKEWNGDKSVIIDWEIQWRGWHVETESNYEDTKSLEGKFRTLKMKIQDQVKLEVKNIQMSVQDLVHHSINNKFNTIENIVKTHVYTISH